MGLVKGRYIKILLFGLLFLGGYVTAVAAPVVTAPEDTVLLSSSVPLSWSGNGTENITEWWVHVGSSIGSKNIYDSGSLGLSTSHVISFLPTDSSSVYVRLWYYVGGWQYIDKEFTACAACASTVQIDSPVQNSTLPNSSADFSWSSITAIDDWWLYLGSSIGESDLYDSGIINSLSSGSAVAITTDSVSVNGLPTDGSIIYARLWYQVDGRWGHVDSQYTACEGCAVSVPEMLNPASGTTLSSQEQEFTWRANAFWSTTSDWWIYVGNTLGGSDIYNSGSLGTGNGQALMEESAIISGLPTDGRDLYFRLWYFTNSQWKYEDFSYTAVTEIQAYICPADLMSEGAFSDSYVADAANNIPFSESFHSLLTVEQIANAFNTARGIDFTTNTEGLVMPTQAVWDAMSYSERALFLINSERCVRGIRVFEGIEPVVVTSPAQTYADLLKATNNGLSHTLDGTPWERLERDAGVNVGSNADFFSFAENLAISSVGTLGTTGTPIVHNPVVKAVYNWMYKDQSSSYGHRNFILATGLVENSGSSVGEGVIGVGVATHNYVSDGNNWQQVYTVLNAFDPTDQWDSNLSHIITVDIFEASVNP